MLGNMRAVKPGFSPTHHTGDPAMSKLKTAFETAVADSKKLPEKPDNMTLLKEQPGYALFEPTPVRPRPVPPVIPNRVDRKQSEALVEIIDIYAGDGLAGIPRGEVNALRVFTYVYGYRGMGGLYGTIGIDGPWDVRRMLGTVPVEPDGSAFFRIPANTPVAVAQAYRYNAYLGEVINQMTTHLK
jgi:hypothetical protein